MQQTEQAQKIRFVVSLIRYLGLTVFAMIVWHVTLTNLISYQQEENAQLAALVAKRKMEIALFEARQKHIVELQARLNFIGELRQQNEQTAKVLNEFGQITIPSTIILNQLKRQAQEITLDGSAQSDWELVRLVDSIAKSPLFTQPIVTDMATQNQMRHFQLHLGIKP